MYLCVKIDVLIPFVCFCHLDENAELPGPLLQIADTVSDTQDTYKSNSLRGGFMKLQAFHDNRSTTEQSNKEEFWIKGKPICKEGSNHLCFSITSIIYAPALASN
jgi:hypothetical protein